MRPILLSGILFILAIQLSAQSLWDDTTATTIDLRNFQLSQKVVRAAYGKAIMYFNQADYLGCIADADTVVITPKYFSHETMGALLRNGQVKIIRRSNNTVETTIIHSPKLNGRMWEYELHDSISFFINFEEIRSFGPVVILPPDSLRKRRKDTVVQKNDFAYVEVFPDTKDTAHVKIKDYFPGRPLTHYVYNNNNGYDELDTNICKSVRLDNKQVFYFAECYHPYGIVSIGITMFGHGAYWYKNDSLFVIAADFERDLNENKTSNSALLLPAYMQPGDSVVNSGSFGAGKVVITLLQKEDLQSGRVTHKDCIKLKIKEYSPGYVYLEYVWLKKEFGLVKWMRSTGRIDELVNSY